MARSEAASRTHKLGRVGTFISLNNTTVLLLRCIFAGFVLATLLYQDSRNALAHEIGYAITITYVAYCCLHYLRHKQTRHGFTGNAGFWIDLLFLSYTLVAINVHNSVFFTLFFFPIIVASRFAKAKTGFLLTLASMLLYVATAITWLDRVKISWLDIASRAVCLLILGSVIVYWAAAEEFARKKLAFLLDVDNAWNPRLGMDRTVTYNLERLVQLYEVGSAILLLKHPNGDTKWKLYMSNRKRPSKINELTPQAAEQLMQLPLTMSTAYSASRRFKLFRPTFFDSTEEARPARRHIEAKREALANILETTSYATVPYTQQDGTIGRIFITASNKDFGRADVQFLIHVSKVISVVQENMYLTEQLIAKAAEYERMQISRDMHDTTIQPYIGLKLALDALLRQAGKSTLAPRIEELTQMTAMTISSLRTYTSQLRERASMPGDSLISALSKQAEVYSRFYHIMVDIKTNITAPINGRVAAELLQIVSEGLSNILRHTEARCAYISLTSSADLISLEIANSCSDERPCRKRIFSPRSIVERATELGGSTTVRNTPDHYTIVTVKIPNLTSLETENGGQER